MKIEKNCPGRALANDSFMRDDVDPVRAGPNCGARRGRLIWSFALAVGVLWLAGCAPKLDSSNPAERQKALKNVTEPDVLIRFALTDPDVGVRLAAVGLVTNQEVLGNMAIMNSNAQVGIAAVKRLTDPWYLTHVALSDDALPEVRLAAIQGLTDQEALAKIAIADESKEGTLRQAAVGKMTDQAALAEVALATDDPASIQKLTDPAVLAKFKSDQQARLVSTALESATPDDALAAFGRLTNPDPALLAQLSQKAVTPQVRAAAVGQMTDQAALAKLAQSDTDSDVRLAAVNRLTDPAALTKVALQRDDPDIRAPAIRKLSDQAVLAQILNEEEKENESDEEKEAEQEIRLAAIGQITDQKVLSACAEIGYEPRLAAAAYMKVTDPAELKVIAESNGPTAGDPQKVAVVELQGQAALEEELTKYRGMDSKILGDPARHLAFRKLTDPALLAKLAGEGEESGIREAAQMRVKGIKLEAELDDVVAGKKDLFDVLVAAKWLEDPDTMEDTVKKLGERLFQKGDPATIPAMVTLINDFGNEKLTLLYANSGQKDLKDAAESWADVHGYTIQTEMTTGPTGYDKWQAKKP